MDIIETYLKNLENKYIVPLLNIYFNKNKTTYDIEITSSPYGYLEESNNDYSKVFQTKFTSSHGLKLKFNQKDIEYIKFINKKIEKMNYYLFCFNVLFPKSSEYEVNTQREKKLKLCKLFCPELLEKMTEANNFKYHPIKKKLFDISINGIQSREDVKLKFLKEKNLLLLDNLEPLYTKQHYLFSKQLISIIEKLSENSKYDQFVAKKLVVSCLFPFVIPKEIQFLFWKDDDNFITTTQFFLSKFKIEPLPKNWNEKFKDFKFTENNVNFNVYSLINNIHKRQSNTLTNFNVGGNKNDVQFETIDFF